MGHEFDSPAARPPAVADTGGPGVESGDMERPGDAACWAHLVCPACGAVISDGHREGCQWDETAAGG